MDYLKPCPFCSGEPKFIHHTTDFKQLPILTLGCCGFRKIGYLIELTKAWNTRK